MFNSTRVKLISDSSSEYYCETLTRAIIHPNTQRISPSNNDRLLFYVNPRDTDVDRRIKTVRGITKPLKLLFAPRYDYQRNATNTDTGLLQHLEQLKSRTVEYESRYVTLQDRYIAVKTKHKNLTSVDKVVHLEGAVGAVTFGKPVKPPKPPKPPKHGRKKSSGNYGNSQLQRGTDVHQQIEYYVNHGIGEFFRTYPRPHPMVNQIIKQLWMYSLTPLMCEFPVYHERLFIGTKIDMVCRNKRGNLVLVELKTGSIKAMCGYETYMEAPFTDVNDCRLWQAVLQVKLAALILELMYNVTPQACCVIVVENDTGITVDVDRFAGWFTPQCKPFLDVFSRGVVRLGLTGASCDRAALQALIDNPVSGEDDVDGEDCESSESIDNDGISRSEAKALMSASTLSHGTEWLKRQQFKPTTLNPFKRFKRS